MSILEESIWLYHCQIKILGPTILINWKSSMEYDQFLLYDLKKKFFYLLLDQDETVISFVEISDYLNELRRFSLVSKGVQ